jgi:endonuclease/exonuclease/phosphatase (EEP) superfamily protein YafD
MLFVLLLWMTVVLVGLTLLPLWRCEAWWVRSLDFPRCQLSIMAAVIILFDLALLDFAGAVSWLLVTIAMACLVYQLWWIAPYTPFFPVEVKSATRTDRHRKISILTANVLATNRKAAALIDLIRASRPDVIVTLESDQWWQSRLDALETDYPHTIKCPLDNLYGMHVYSKLPVLESQIKFLVEPDVPSMQALVQLPSEQPVRIHFLHPSPPSPTENEASTERDAELLVVAKSVAHSKKPVIVTGDLNDVAWSETTRLFRKISGLLDPRVGRGMFNTFHAEYWFMRWPLDHLFHSNHFRLSTIRRMPRFGSDHFALFTELSYEPEHKTESNGLEADWADRRWANQKINAQNVGQEDVTQP